MSASFLGLGLALAVFGGEPAPPAASTGKPAVEAPAVEPPAGAGPETPNTVEPVVVTGRRTPTEAEQRRIVSSFVRELAEPTVRRRLARWERKVCPGVVGLPAVRGAYLLDRFAEEATALGLDVDRPGCRPTSLIVITGRPDEFARRFREDHRRWFAHLSFPGDMEAGGGGQTLGEFLVSDQPVRWWHVSTKADSGSPPSRLHSGWREELSRALVIVDAAQLEGVTYEQLASYLAFVVLAQSRPEARPQGLASITTLFADRRANRTAPEALTNWDRAYLKGLYQADGDSVSLHTQRGAIRRSLAELAKRSGAKGEP